MKTHMIATPRRESVTIEIDPQVTHTASGIAAERGSTTAEVIAEFLENEFLKLAKTIPAKTQPT